VLGRALGCLFAGALAAGCSSSSDAAKQALINPDPPGKMYARADALMTGGNYSEAAKKFEDVDRDHPYASEARRALVMAAYSYYKAGKYQEAIASAQRYTSLHPGTKDAALAHHIIASAYFDEINDPARDQGATRKALAELKTLTQRYPDSPYNKQAMNRIRIAEDTLAAAEMNVARFYQNRKNPLAAINRYKVVVTEYQTTAHVEEALYRLAEANMSLGIVPEAQTAAAVLGHNYPNSQWYAHAYALLKSGGVSPQVNKGTWFGNTLKALPPGQQKKPEPAAQPVPAEPAPGMPRPEDMPAPRGAPGDVPMSSVPGKPSVSFAQRNE
jgi:outer membrane protein assembly factor BamD